MTEQRKDEIEKKVFYRYIEPIMRTLERCEDTHLVFQIGMEMGYMHRSLSEELSKEIEPQEGGQGMTKEEKEAVLHCLRSMIDEEHCEECSLYGTTGTDHCEKDCVRLAIEELEQDEYIKVPKKALKYRTAGIVAYNAEWLKNHFDIERAVICGVQEHYEDAISRQAVLDKLNRLIEVERLQGTDEMGYGRERVSAYESMIFEIESEYLYPSVSSSEKPNKCEDAISRQAAIDAIYARYIGGKEAVDKAPANDQYAEGIDEAVCAVEDLPPVTPQPKSECEHDHEILKAYSDGASAVLDNVRAEIESKYESIPETFHHYETGFTDALEWVLSIIDKYAEGSEKE